MPATRSRFAIASIRFSRIEPRFLFYVCVNKSLILFAPMTIVDNRVCLRIGKKCLFKIIFHHWHTMQNYKTLKLCTQGCIFDDFFFSFVGFRSITSYFSMQCTGLSCIFMLSGLNISVGNYYYTTTARYLPRIRLLYIIICSHTHV